MIPRCTVFKLLSFTQLLKTIKRVVQGYFRDTWLLFFVNREFNKLFFVFCDQMFVRAPRKARISNYRYWWFYFLFLPDFQFRELRKINKENESILMRMMNFCKLLFAVLLFPFATYDLFSDTLLPLFCLRTRWETVLYMLIIWLETEMKVWYPWFVISYFLVREQCN